MRALCATPLFLLFAALPTALAAPQTLDGFLGEGRVKEGLRAFASPREDSGRFSLAILQALDGLQQFSADSTRLGVNREFVANGLPFFRMMAPAPALAPASTIATPEKLAALFSALRTALQQANNSLATIDGTPFKVEVNLSAARLDFDGDGVVASDELLIAKMAPALGLAANPLPSQSLVIRFDSADASWLKGYTHFLVGVIDILLAYEWRPVWDQCANVFFRNAQPAPAIARFTAAGPDGRFTQWADLIAAIHDLRLELADKSALSRAREEFLSMTACSRLCWQRVLAETDNDREWLPSPKQTGPAGTKITHQQIDGWLKVLDELDAILSGKKLLPHWRLKNGIGINVPKLVASPPKLDLILLVQGSALVPYIEEGAVSDRAAWRTLMEPFGPGFFRFALWSN